MTVDMKLIGHSSLTAHQVLRERASLVCNLPSRYRTVRIGVCLIGIGISSCLLVPPSSKATMPSFLSPLPSLPFHSCAVASCAFTSRHFESSCVSVPTYAPPIRSSAWQLLADHPKTPALSPPIYPIYPNPHHPILAHLIPSHPRPTYTTNTAYEYPTPLTEEER
ncbi:hypothetical protein LX36DRAFT_127453 [Colletotrichum falcatum]|nr:hypothetical protein LX36DRAFT_127453 [Colletotrichum falcatum]